MTGNVPSAEGSGISLSENVGPGKRQSEVMKKYERERGVSALSAISGANNKHYPYFSHLQ